MYNTIIVRYGEIALKGRNRRFFEEKLVANIKLFFKKHGANYKSIKRSRSRILITTNEDCNFLRHVFGITSFSHASKTKADIKKIEKKCLELVLKKLNKHTTFKVSTNRINKDFGLNSLEINKKIGKLIKNKIKAKVDLKNPDLTVGIEVADYAYIFTRNIKGPGGLPVGVEGSVYVLIEDEDSILAGILAMKRGCSIIPVAHKKTNIDILKKFDPNLKLEVVKELKEIKTALIVGQTLDNLRTTNKCVVLTPLIAYSKEEIKNRLGFYKNLNS